MNKKPKLNEIDMSGENIDEYLKGVIKIEKRHLYGLEQTSTQKRRDEIFAYLMNVLIKK